jgi:hypothetical protein
MALLFVRETVLLFRRIISCKRCATLAQTLGIRLTRDNEVSVVYADGLNSTTSSVMLQRTDRHGIVVRQVALKRK